ncbi:MAG: dihydrofolate reductase [Verrucomicrobiota bacterium JB023]|nr:dihydrofolate reductase [Verrucomicrobiota bacterium JB023]
MPPLIAIVAHDPNRLIGANGALPWHLPADLAFFKKTTLEHSIVMGRKTYDSIGCPLPKRQNIVLTRDQDWRQEGVETISSLDALNKIPLRDGPVYIIGGAQVYQAALPLLDSLLVTHVRAAYEGDTWFPEYESLFPREELVAENEEFVIKRHLRP